MSKPQEMLIDGKPLSDLLVVDLKDQLEKRGLSKNGTKPVLVERLLNALAMEQKGTALAGEQNRDDQRNDSEPPPQAIKTRSAANLSNVSSGDSSAGAAPLVKTKSVVMATASAGTTEVGGSSTGSARGKQKSVVMTTASAASTEASGGQRGGGDETSKRTTRATRRTPADQLDVIVEEESLPRTEQTPKHRMTQSKYNQTLLDSITRCHQDHINQHAKDDLEDQNALLNFARGAMSDMEAAQRREKHADDLRKAAVQQVDTLSTQNADLNTQVTQLNKDKKTLRDERDKAVEEKATSDSELKKVKQAYQELKERARSGQTVGQNQLDDMHDELVGVKAHAEDLEQKNAALALELQAMTAAYDRLKAKEDERKLAALTAATPTGTGKRPAGGRGGDKDRGGPAPKLKIDFNISPDNK